MEKAGLRRGCSNLATEYPASIVERRFAGYRGFLWDGAIGVALDSDECRYWWTRYPGG